ncbi:SET and MYND domain-containing protein 4 isoform X3 [Cryptotermes secundus]|uniref:SET and MYND domain-containing protein 4 isoform X2 n=1 Tax=Cryptotermes secundus TaxID=105785 RepID=UPI000CD7CF25|nr:SET and MYND domain-containing protein 4 isoform X2 [Cryptotermes secundus]XP_023723065.1 SET and MYND domain-containing protein 4 isoform X3 [Cryptotermes secundus]
MIKNWQELLDAVTLESNKIGTSKKISSLKLQEDMVELWLNENVYREKLLDWIKFTHSNAKWMKTATVASKLRIQGNEKFKECDNVGSLMLYTESVVHAPRDSEELSLALANRSAALFHLGAYQESLQDIALAFQSGYPTSLHYKLHMRRSQCFSRLNRYMEEVEALQSAQKCLELMGDVALSKKSSSKRNIELALSKASSQLRIGSTENISDSPKTFCLPVPTYGENERFAYASAALDLRYSQEKGRHVVANRGVQMGDILFVERPYAFVVLPDQYRAHCHNCCSLYMSAVPCEECTLARYCSEACRQESWDQYHQWECHGGLELLNSIGIAHLGFRVVLKAGPLRKLQGIHTKLQESVSQSKDTYRDKQDNYRYVYQLMPHLEDMQHEDLFQYTMTACMLALYLTYCTHYFTEEANPLPPDELLQNRKSTVCFVGGLILRHIAQLVCNGHAITKLDKTFPENENREVLTEHQVRIATAIYPSASMMNHSCDPNIINSFYNQYLIVRACRDIPRGGEVFNCYGPHFRHMGTRERQEILRSQYFFSCTCKPCSLPGQQDFQERFSALLCSECSGPLLRTSESPHRMACGDCGHRQNISSLVEASFKARALFDEGSVALDVGDMAEALKMFESCWHLRRHCLYRSHRDLTVCVDQVAKCYSMLEKSIKRLRSMCRELNEFWNCSMGYGTLGYRTSSARNNNWNKWLFKII